METMENKLYNKNGRKMINDTGNHGKEVKNADRHKMIIVHRNDVKAIVHQWLLHNADW